MMSHMALDYEHISNYETEVGGIRIAKCVRVTKKSSYGFGRSNTNYYISGDKKTYKSHKAAVTRINALLAEKGEAE